MIGIYVLQKPLGDLGEEGTRVEMDSEEAQPLIDAGVLAEATGDENNEEENNDEAPTPVDAAMTRSLDRLGKKLEDQVAKAAAEAVKKLSTKKATDRKPDLGTGFYVANDNKIPVYKNVGDMVRGVFKANILGDAKARKQLREHELQTKSPLGVNETTSAQGGYTVNPQFSDDIWANPHGTIDLMPYCGIKDAQSNVLNIRAINETSLANGSIYGGIEIVATSEGASLTASQPAYQNIPLTLTKQTGFIYYTNEVLEDTSYPLEQEINEYVAKAFIYYVNSQILQGSSFEGLLNAPSLVTVTHSSNDTNGHGATPITYADLANMWGSLYPDCKGNAIWLFHPELDSALNQMTYTYGGDTPAWGLQFNAENGKQGGPGGPVSPYKLYGRPMFPCWGCSAPGLPGDVMVVDLSQSTLFRKPMRMDVSKEFQFGTDQVAVRFVLRLNHITQWRSAVTGPTGTQSFSPFVALSSRGS